MKWIRRCADWLRDHPWICTAFFAGAMLGLLICLPLLPFELPDSSANVIGAALGALFAVWGAAWVSDHKERQHHRRLVRAIASTVEPTFAHVKHFVAALNGILADWHNEPERDARVEAIQKLVTQVDPLLGRIAHMESRVDFLVPVFLQLGGDGVVAHGTLTAAGPALRESLEKLRWAGFYDEYEVLKADTFQLNRETNGTLERAERAVDLLRRFAR